MDKTAEATLAKIAQGHLLLDTLETRNRDCLDFHELSVGAIRSALQAAYEAGKAAALAGAS